MKNINPSVLSAVGLYVMTSGFIFSHIDSQISYYGDNTMTSKAQVRCKLVYCIVVLVKILIIPFVWSNLMTLLSLSLLLHYHQFCLANLYY